MSKIDELIAKHCPKGVEFKELGKICVIANNKRKPVKASLRVAGKIPYYGANNIQGYVEGFTHEGNYVLIAEDGSANLDNYSIQYTEGKFWANNHVHVIKGKNELNNRFLFYYFRSINFRSFLSGGDRAKLTKAKLVEIKIPVPPLKVQEEIVDILDKFTKLEAELEAELEARQKQYAHYRDELLNFDQKEDVKWMTLGEVSTMVSSGGTPLSTCKDYYGGDIPWLRTQEVRFIEINDTEMRITEKAVKETSAKWIPANCVIIAISGATAGRSAVNKIPLTTNQHCCNLQIDSEKALWKYVFYWVSKEYEQIKGKGQGARSDLNAGIIKKYPIPVPPLEEQERIVATLDKFDALVNNISSGLPAEITARRRQYQYYRNRLLTFKEVA